jgi:ubiquinone/menaquinone biosynthesis C-methylase UbiE
MAKNETRFWAKRATKYNNLEWANKGDYLHTFLNTGKFHENDVVLDVGSGTGIIAHTVAPFVKQVIGVDISEDMLKRAHNPAFKNVQFARMDAHELKFKSGTFHKITARMVFHHIVDHAPKAMHECFRVLKKNGLMVFSEGVPPTQHVVPFYTEMFKLKENRITFMEKDLVGLMRHGGFRGIKKKIFWLRQASIRNWLQNSGLPQKTQNRIFEMHLELDPQGKRDYNMTLRDNDCFIDMKFIILTGTK